MTDEAKNYIHTVGKDVDKQLKKIEEYRDFIRLVKKMRGSQQAYFRGRRKSDLNEAKRLEFEVDKHIRDYFDTQTNLFES